MSAKENVQRDPIIFRLWAKWLLLVFVFFIPVVTQKPYNPYDTPKVINTILSQPLITKMPSLFPIAKLLLLIVLLLPFIIKKMTTRVVLFYYGFILIMVGIFQNMAITQEYGFAWIIGNTIIMFVLAALSFLYGIKQNLEFKKAEVNKLWLLPFILLAILCPYSFDRFGNVVPGIGLSIFTNMSGLAYCLVTPVILGLMLIFSNSFDKRLLSFFSFYALYFAIMNILTFFLVQSKSWWMGVLHFPLLITSIYGLIESRRKNFII